MSTITQAPRQQLSTLLAKTFPYEESETLDRVAGILLGKIDPSEVEATQRWIDNCYHRPSKDEQEMHALNALLDAHGVEHQVMEEVRLYDGEDANGEPIEDRAEIDASFTYLNTGDAYTQTLIFYDGDVYATDCGSFIETIEQQVQAHYNAGADVEDFEVDTRQLPGRHVALLVSEVQATEMDETPHYSFHSQNNMTM